MISIADTQGSGTVRTTRHVDVTQMTFPYQPGDYVVHAAHGIALFREIVQQDVGGAIRDYLLLEYAEGDKLYVPLSNWTASAVCGPEAPAAFDAVEYQRLVAHAVEGAQGHEEACIRLGGHLYAPFRHKGFRYSPDTPGRRRWRTRFPTTRRPISLPLSQMSKRICSLRSRWIAWSAAMWDSGKRRSPCAPHSRRARTRSR